MKIQVLLSLERDILDWHFNHSKPLNPITIMLLENVIKGKFKGPYIMSHALVARARGLV